MFGLGTGELLLILIVILLLFGATRLPALLGGLGKGVKEFKKAMRDDEPSKASAELAVELRSDIGKRAVLLPDGTLEVGGDTGAFLKDVDGEWATLQDDVMTAKLSLASVKKVVRRS